MFTRQSREYPVSGILYVSKVSINAEESLCKQTTAKNKQQRDKLVCCVMIGSYILLEFSVFIIVCSNLQVIFVYEPTHDKTYYKTCATSEDSDQTAHLRSLIRVFAYRICILQPPSYPKRDKREHLPYWVDELADLQLCWSHTYRCYCGLCRVLAQLCSYA